MEIREGAKVAYVGAETRGFKVGDIGKVVSAAGGNACHVSWRSGDRKGDIEMMSSLEVTPVSTEPATAARDIDLDDSLEYGGPILSFSARKVYDQEGFDGLVSALGDDGHLATLAGRVADIVAGLVNDVRNDAAVIQTTAALDYDEIDEFVGSLVAAMVRDALGKTQDGE